MRWPSYLTFTDPADALEPLVAWLGERGHHEIDAYAADARRIAWLQARGFTHRRSSFDLERVGPRPEHSKAAAARQRILEDVRKHRHVDAIA